MLCPLRSRIGKFGLCEQPHIDVLNGANDFHSPLPLATSVQQGVSQAIQSQPQSSLRFSKWSRAAVSPEGFEDSTELIKL